MKDNDNKDNDDDDAEQQHKIPPKDANNKSIADSTDESGYMAFLI